MFAILLSGVARIEAMHPIEEKIKLLLAPFHALVPRVFIKDGVIKDNITEAVAAVLENIYTQIIHEKNPCMSGYWLAQAMFDEEVMCYYGKLSEKIVGDVDLKVRLFRQMTRLMNMRRELIELLGFVAVTHKDEPCLHDVDSLRKFMTEKTGGVTNYTDYVALFARLGEKFLKI
jgi:hypothetical protein